jgi:hypothetical protein
MRYWLVVTVALCLAQSALAASGVAMPGPPTTVMIGTTMDVSSVQSTGICGSGGGPASFQRQAISADEPMPEAIISLPSVTHAGLSKSTVERAGAKPDKTNPVRGTFEGAMVLKFASATAGTVFFDYRQADPQPNPTLPSGYYAGFTNYSQVWTPGAGTLQVGFTFVFKNCTLPIVALFRTAQ